MEFKPPKDDAKYHWTQHVVRKMLYYGLSADRIKRVVRNPKRVEEGVAPNTLAVMQPAGSKNNPWEIWVMYAQPKSGLKKKEIGLASLLATNRKIIITAWKYPGVSPIRDQVPIPSDILAELQQEGVEFS